MADLKTKPKVPRMAGPPEQPGKKKKQNAPDKPQPAWLFPPADENPVLNPKPKTDETVMRETADREKALDYMQRRVHAVPDRPAPPAQLLTMIGIFLSEYGFNSTSRVFNTERKGRQHLTGYEHGVGEKIEKGTPSIEKIYRHWYKEWKATRVDETSSDESESESDDSSTSDAPAKAADVQMSSSDEDDSEASSDGFGGSDVEMIDTTKVPKKGTSIKKSSPTDASSSTSTSSDSDADDEKDAKPRPPSHLKATATRPTTAAMKPTAATLNNVLKRKTLASSDSSASEDSSDSSENERPSQAKKVKTLTTQTTAVMKAPLSSKKTSMTSTKSNKTPGDKVSTASSSSSSSSSSEPESDVQQAKAKKNSGYTKIAPADVALPASSSSEDNDSDEDSSSSSSDGGVPTKKQSPANVLRTTLTSSTERRSPPPDQRKSSTESSVTINGDSKKPSSDESPASSSSVTSSSSDSGSDKVSSPKKEPFKAPSKLAKKHQGAKPTALAELSSQADPDSHLSNAYIPNAYAEKAYQDLSVTRGKGFTKEKNKKKRGSYRGGAIDTQGGKSFKFDD